MGNTVTLTKTGQITIPKWVRDTLGVQPGERIVFRKNRGSVSIEREKRAAEIAAEIDKLIPDEIRARHMQKFAGMTTAEMLEEWVESGDAAEYFKREERRAA